MKREEEEGRGRRRKEEKGREEEVGRGNLLTWTSPDEGKDGILPTPPRAVAWWAIKGVKSAFLLQNYK